MSRQIIALGSNLNPLGHNFYKGLYRENFREISLCQDFVFSGPLPSVHCLNYGIKIGSALGVTSLTRRAHMEKTLEISLNFVIKPKASKFCLLLYLVGLHLECVNYSPRVEFNLEVL